MFKTLKGRISLIYLGLVTLTALVGLTTVFNLFRLSNSIDGLMTANYKSIKVINIMLQEIEKQDYAIIIYLKSDPVAGINSFLESQDRFWKSFHIEANNITEPGEKELVRDINRNYLKYLKSFAALQELKNRQGINAAIAFNDSVIRLASSATKKMLARLADLNEKAMFHGKNQATFSAQKSMYFILILSLLAITGGFAVAGILINRFFRPVTMLTETVKLVKAGDLNRQAPVVYRDEIGELAHEFNNMTQRLLQYEQSTIGRLMAEKNRTVTIVKSISDPLIVLDRGFRVMLINNAGEAIFEVEETQALNKHFLEVIKNRELFDYISGVLESKDETRQKVIIFRSQNIDYYFNMVAKIVKEPDAVVNSLVILFQNITQIKQVEKLKTDFIATVSHEFKTPLTSLIMGLSLLVEKRIGPLNDQQLKTLETLKDDGENLTNLVNNLLEISGLESGNSFFKIQPCPITALIENSTKKFLDQAASKEVSLIFEADDDLPKVKADPEKIQWVLNNLISNALKYTNAGDEISLSAQVKHGKMCVSVKDTGVGIPPEYLDKLFDRFVQVKGYDLEVRGTGLGLAIAKEIVEAHGGEIWCESKLDSGSIFTFTLPLNGGEKP